MDEFERSLETVRNLEPVTVEELEAFRSTEWSPVRASRELSAEAANLGSLILDRFRPLLDRIARYLSTRRITSRRK